MVPPWVFGRLQIVALALLACVAAKGVVMLYRRGISPFPSLPNRPWLRRLKGAGLFLDLGLWAYEVVACAWPLPVHIVPHAWLTTVLGWQSARLAGVGLLAAGLLVYARALQGLGMSWRLGIDRESAGPPVTSGIYAWSRNPIYVGLLLFGCGTGPVLDNWLFVAVALLTTATIHLVVRAEERFLAQAFGAAFGDYAARVGRYVTWAVGGRGAGGSGGQARQDS